MEQVAQWHGALGIFGVLVLLVLLVHFADTPPASHHVRLYYTNFTISFLVTGFVVGLLGGSLGSGGEMYDFHTPFLQEISGRAQGCDVEVLSAAIVQPFFQHSFHVAGTGHSGECNLAKRTFFQMLNCRI